MNEAEHAINAGFNKTTSGVLTKNYTLGFVGKSLTSDNQNTYTFVITTNQIDRQNEVIQTRGIDTTGFMANPVALYLHDSYTIPIGTWKKIWIVTENGVDKMYGTMVFAFTGNPEIDEKANDIKALVDADVLRSVSISVRVTKSHTEKAPPEYVRMFDNYVIDTINVVDQCEMIEVSIVIIPANASALRVKAFELHDNKKLSDKQFEELIKVCDTMDTDNPNGGNIDKSGATLSAKNRDVIQKALDTLDAHDSAHKKAFNECRTHLKTLLNSQQQKPESEPDEDDKPAIDRKSLDDLVDAVADKVMKSMRKEFGREFQTLHNSIEKQNIHGGCDCNQEDKRSEDSKTYNINDLKKHFNKDQHAE